MTWPNGPQQPNGPQRPGPGQWPGQGQRPNQQWPNQQWPNQQWPNQPQPVFGGYQPGLPPNPPNPPTPPNRRRRLVWLIPAVVVVVAAAITVPLVLGRQGAGSTGAASGPGRTGPTTATTRPVPAVDRTFLDIEPGTGQPLTWGSTPMYDACSVLPMSTLARVGVKLNPAYSVFVDRPEPGNPGGAGATQQNIPFEGSSDCFYPGPNQAGVGLNIYQPPFSSSTDVQTAVDYGLTGTKRTKDGIAISTVDNPNGAGEWNVVFSTPQFAATMAVNLPPGSYRGHQSLDPVNALSDAVATALAAPPAPAAAPRYAAPYTGIDPCQLFSEQDFQRNVGSPDDEHPHAAYQLGERDFTPDPGTNLAAGRYVDAQCQRMALALDKGDSTALGLVVEFRVFQNEAQAHADITETCDPHSSGSVYGPPVPESVKVGDDKVCYPTIKAGDWQLTFRSGRTVASVWPWATIDRSQLDKITPGLAVLANEIAVKLRST